MLPRLQRRLLDAGHDNFRFLIVGQGAEQAYLKQHLHNAEFTGVLKGEELGAAYASMDAFIFPSETDTYGNVVLEALASGIPAIVMEAGGPRFIVQHGITGLISRDEESFARHMTWLLTDSGLCHQMSENARAYAETKSWDAVFEDVYDVYKRMLNPSLQKEIFQRKLSSTLTIQG